jgi:hypothetical protein
MSEFVFVIPSGWYQVGPEVLGEIGSIIDSWINLNDFASLTEALRPFNVIPAEFNVYEARLFNGEVLAIRAS